MLPAQIGDVTDDVSQGEGCQTTTAAIAEQLVHFAYWLQGLQDFMSWVI